MGALVGECVEDRVEDATAVVHRVIVPQPHFAGLRVHFHHRQVRAEWKRVVGRLEDALLRESRLDAGRETGGVVGFVHHLRKRHGLRPIRGSNRFVLEDQLAGFHTQLVRGDARHLLFQPLRGEMNRRSAHGRRAAAEGPDAERHHGGVAVIDRHVVVRDAQAFGHDLREAGLLALAMRRSPAEHRRLAGPLDPHGAVFPAARRHAARRPHGADLDVGGKPDAEIPSLLSQPLLLLAEARVARQSQDLLERLLIIRRVVGDAGGERQRELFRLRKVFHPHVHRVHLEFARHQIHGALDDVGGFGPPGAAVSVRRHLVREDAFGLDKDVRDLVRADDHQRRERGDGGRQ